MSLTHLLYRHNDIKTKFKTTYSHLIVSGIAFDNIKIKIAMNLNNLTLKSQEVVQAAQQLAFERGHQEIENISFRDLLKWTTMYSPIYLKNSN